MKVKIDDMSNNSVILSLEDGTEIEIGVYVEDGLNVNFQIRYREPGTWQDMKGRI